MLLITGNCILSDFTVNK